MAYFRSLTLWLLLQSVTVLAADGQRTVVHLEIKRGIPAFSFTGIDFGQSGQEKVIAAPGSSRNGKAPAAIVHAEPIEGQPGAYRLLIRSFLGEPVAATVTPAAAVRVEIPRGAGLLPYRIALDPNSGPNGSPQESMRWAADYRAEGTLTIGSCHALLVVWDMIADGVFNRRDFTKGSAVGIDLNGDGKIFGREEYVSGGQIFQFCGKSFYVDPDSLQPDGSGVTVVEKSAKPKVGAPMPSLVLNTLDGGTIHSESWKGKVTVLDFWASWCVYCIEGFPILKEMRKTFAPALEIIAINADEPSRAAAARKVLRDRELPWPQVLSGQGLSDPVWMIFRADDASSVPLYVVADREGVIRYIGPGGERLTDLRAAIGALTLPPVGAPLR